MKNKKYEILCEQIAKLGRVGIAFSGGVDSTLLLFSAVESLGVENVFPLHLRSGLHSPESHQFTIQVLQKSFPDTLKYTEISVDPFGWQDFADNPPHRCYLCKKRMYSLLIEHLPTTSMVLADGTNYDDLAEDRPGLRAIDELGIRTPLADCKLGKREIRQLAKEKGLMNWDLPSNSCFATRVQHGERIERETIGQIERAERFLEGVGFTGCRARKEKGGFLLEFTHEDFTKLADQAIRSKIQSFFSSIDCLSVSVSLKTRDC